MSPLATLTILSAGEITQDYCGPVKRYLRQLKPMRSIVIADPTPTCRGSYVAVRRGF